ncbi:Fibrillin-1 [Stylophora pistillata]|uniref:Fibrillin-1 n=1 Tax=Stylophora pistillata TaxID=50429 RepID=A0A2B4RCU9_STYPI|nr:Fibrillin-1 [Stylophora pistillata]
MMLQKHIFKTITGAAFGDVCLRECYRDVRCQSFNFAFTQDKCELSNRTKEARPEDFIPNSERYYFRRDMGRTHLGAIPELPADSCKEIKASEGGQAVSGLYWLNFIKPDTPVLAHCDMKTEDADECNAFIRVCDENADCKNTLGSYRCSCKTGFSGDGHTCKECQNCQSLTGADRRINYTNQDTICDNGLRGWYRFQGAAGHTELPNGESLHGEPLKNAQSNIFSEYATDIVVKKLSPSANCQRNESLNNTIAKKTPKTRYYRGSASNDFRVACGVAQRNLGYGYVSAALEVLDIEPGYFCTSHEDLMDKKVLSDRNRKATKNFKYRSNQLRGQKSSQKSQKEAKEGKTYETAVVLNLDTSVNQPSPRTHTHVEHLFGKHF